MKGVFVTGTDTEVGKTVVATGILRKAADAGLKSCGYKPVAAGCTLVDNQPRNDDALALMGAANFDLPYTFVNPVALEPAIAPHIAAAATGTTLDTRSMLDGLQRIRDSGAEFCVVEGAGGWFVPLNDDETFADFAVAAQLPVILTVGLKLGCINHAILSAMAIVQKGAELYGWVGNFADAGMDVAEENIETLRARLNVPCLGIVGHLQDPSPIEVSKYLNLDVAEI